MENIEVDEPLDKDCQGCAAALDGLVFGSIIILVIVLIFWIGCNSKYLEG